MIHWIRFPNDKEHVKAIGAWRDITEAHLGLPDDQAVVTDTHIKALKRARVKFHYISKPHRNAKTSASRKSSSRRHRLKQGVAQ